MISGLAQVIGMKPTLRSFFSSAPFPAPWLPARRPAERTRKCPAGGRAASEGSEGTPRSGAGTSRRPRAVPASGRRHRGVNSNRGRSGLAARPQPKTSTTQTRQPGRLQRSRHATVLRSPERVGPSGGASGLPSERGSAGRGPAASEGSEGTPRSGAGTSRRPRAVPAPGRRRRGANSNRRRSGLARRLEVGHQLGAGLAQPLGQQLHEFEQDLVADFGFVGEHQHQRVAGQHCNARVLQRHA
jgi:hypothetical protein